MEKIEALDARHHLRCFTFKELGPQRFLCLEHNREFNAPYVNLSWCRVGWNGERFEDIKVLGT